MSETLSALLCAYNEVSANRRTGWLEEERERQKKQEEEYETRTRTYIDRECCLDSKMEARKRE